MQRVGDQEVEVRIADGRTGVIPRDDVDRAQLAPLEVGATIRAAVLHREDRRGRIPMSASWAAKADAWDRLARARDERFTVTGQVSKAVKGGVLVDLGVRAFLPRSLVGDLDGDPADLVGTEVEVVVQELDRDADRVVVSRRGAQRRRQRAEQKKAFAEIATGQRHRGVVTEVLDFGALVQIGAVSGLVHRSELSWSYMSHPSDVVSVGDEVDVEVVEVVRSKRRIGLSMRRAGGHPLASIAVGSIHTATVLRVMDYGAFARLQGTDAEGLLHVSQLSELPGARADQLVVPGEELQVCVLSIDEDRNRMALSALPATLADPPGSNPP